MFKEMVFYHSILIYLTLGVLIIGILIPFLGKSGEVAIKRMRIYMFFIHSFFTMVAFSGLVAFAFAKMSFSFSIFVMIILYIFISTIESFKYLKILKLPREDSESMVKMRTLSIRFTITNIILILAMIFWEIGEHSSAVSIS
jgi:hypothetical protein